MWPPNSPIVCVVGATPTDRRCENTPALLLLLLLLRGLSLVDNTTIRLRPFPRFIVCARWDTISKEHGRGVILDQAGCRVCEVECAAGVLVGGRTVCPGSLGGGKGPKCRGRYTNLESAARAPFYPAVARCACSPLYFHFLHV